MEDEEPDYMSDDFLTSCVAQDIRPGLLSSRAKKREHESLKKKIEFQKKQKTQNEKFSQEKMREEGLNKPIDSSNKGFALLQKMGYKPGIGIGKTESGRTEPIGINVKNDRKGLGRETAMKEVKALKASFAVKKAKKELVSTDDFRARLAAEAAERYANIDFGRSQKVCYELDLKEEIEKPAEPWFWPPKNEPSENDEEESSSRSEEKSESESDEEGDVEYSVFEKLKLITTYLKTAHLYCIWCGVQYEDVEDINQSCPGSTREDH